MPSVAAFDVSTRDLMLWEKFLTFDVLATNLMLTGLLFLFSTFPIRLRWNKVRFIIFKFLSSISHLHLCLIIIQNWRSSRRWVENNILRYAWPTSPFNNDTSLYFGFNEGYRNLIGRRGPTSFNLRAILQKCDNLRATSNKMMYDYKTTCSQDLKLEREDKWVRHWNCFTIANSNFLQISVSEMLVVYRDFSDISFL